MTSKQEEQIKLIKEQFKEAPQYFAIFENMINQIKDDDKKLTAFLNSILEDND